MRSLETVKLSKEMSTADLLRNFNLTGPISG